MTQASFFPHGDTLKVADRDIPYQEILEILEPLITNSRKQKIENVVKYRTFDIAVGCEKLYDLGNVNAVLRSCENLGFQSLHIIESEYTKMSNRITQGAHKWVDTHRYKKAQTCIKTLKDRGYKIYSTHLHETSKPMTEIDWSIPACVFFGNEKEGISQELLESSDENVIIPTVGFTESFNISVAAALLLNHIFQARWQQGLEESLSQVEQEILKAHLLYRSQPCADKILLNSLK